MGHTYNHGVVTSSKGVAMESIRLKCTDGSGTLAVDEDCGAGIISGVTRNSQGNYTLQFVKPYPPKVIILQPTLSQASETTASLEARYKRASYDATAGTAVVFISNSAGTSAADPAQNDELHILLHFNRYTAKP